MSDELYMAILDGQNSMGAKLDGLRGDVAAVNGKTDSILQAFPEDEHGRPDILGHRAEHEAYRGRKQNRRDLLGVLVDNATRVAIALVLTLILAEKFPGALKLMKELL